MKIKVCHCEQCKYVKAKRKNRILKKKIKRMCNKLRRKELEDTKYFNYYWA